MPNNFLLTGAAYTSKAGSDSNAGTTTNTPKATINSAVSLALAGNTIVGTGMYSESLGGTYNGLTGLIADGKVIVYGDSSMSWGLFGTNVKIVGFEFRGLLTVNSIRIEDCIFDGITTFSSNAGGTFLRCIFINCTWAGTNSGRYTFDQCIFINCTVRDCNKMVNCYMNGVSSLRTVAGITAANFDGNNLMGTIAVSDTNYLSFAAHRTANPTLNVNSFNLSPKFNAVEKKDFTLQFDSPHLRVDGLNIGGTQTARPTVVTDSEWLVGNGAIWQNVEMNANDIVLTAGATVGTITSAPIRTGANASEIEAILYNGALNFNKSTAGGSTSNLNVPDTNAYAGNDATGMGNPDRLTYEMRWSLAEVQPITSTDWTNGNLLPSGNWGVFTYNNAPRVDNTGKSTGASGYNPATTNAVNAIWVQFRITLRNNYL